MRAIGIFIFAGLVLVAGCSQDKPTTQPVSVDERQEKALNDPMNWKPNFQKESKTGKGIGEFDKEGFKHDVDRVFNP